MLIFLGFAGCRSVSLHLEREVPAIRFWPGSNRRLSFHQPEEDILMYTAMAVVALTLGVTSGNLSPNPVWLDDYGVAQTRVAESGKPMVVFVGSGKEGQTRAIREGAFDPAIAKLLSGKFVCLYVDTNTRSGRVLADAFQIKDAGIVISDRTGKSQAFSSAVPVSKTELEIALSRYADEKVVPAGGPVPPGAVVPAGHAVYGGGPGYGYGGGCGKGWGGGCGKGFGFGGGCCFKGWGGGCCGKGYAAPVVVQPPAKVEPPKKVELKKVEVKPAPATVVVAQPMGYGGCGKGWGGGCCGWGGGCGKGFAGWGGGGCGQGWGGGFYGGCCK
jgi:hypothetical protein